MFHDVIELPSTRCSRLRRLFTLDLKKVRLDMVTVTEAFRFFALHFYVQGYLMPLLTIYTLLTGKTDVVGAVTKITDRTQTTFYKTKDSAKLENGCVYLCNHRSWADFFIDQYLCNGAAFLSRKMVIVGTPMSALWAYLNNSTWFFTRRSGIDRAKFFMWIDSKFKTRAEYGLIAYPEGTRNHGDKPKPLKSGVIHYAFEYKRKVQIVMTTNKERVVNEKQWSCNYGTKCLVYVSPVFDPKDFKSFEEFKTVIKEAFMKAWQKAYGQKIIEESEGNKLRDNSFEEFTPPLLKSRGEVRIPKECYRRQRVVRLLLFIALSIIIRAATR